MSPQPRRDAIEARSTTKIRYELVRPRLKNYIRSSKLQSGLQLWLQYKSFGALHNGMTTTIEDSFIRILLHNCNHGRILEHAYIDLYLVQSLNIRVGKLNSSITLITNPQL